MFFRQRKQRDDPPAVPQEQLQYNAPSNLIEGKAIAASLQSITPSGGVTSVSVPPLAPDSSAATTHQAESCAICLDTLQKGLRIKACQHCFHEDCLKSHLAHDNKCAVCRKPVGGAPQGRCPSGTMKIQLTRKDCPGFNAKAIQIDYNIPSGRQARYHDNPGAPFRGDSRTAFLPDTREGRSLLHRLKYAFMQGLTFTVGTSLTTGRKDVVTWTSIHHKTSLQGGQHGFPDATYIYRCNESLTALGVPPCHANPPVSDETLYRNAPTTLSSSHVDLEDYLEEFVCPTSPSANAALPPLPPPCAPAIASGSSVPRGLAPAMPALPVALPPPVFAPSAPPLPLDALKGGHDVEIIVPTETSTFAATTADTSTAFGDCSICFDALDPLKQRLCVQICHCQHKFHHDCLTGALNRGDCQAECPLCRCSLGPQGKSPCGKMTICLHSDTKCPGFDGAGTIQIDYSMKAGRQQPYHENPGLSYDSVQRVAYLPHTHEGVALLQRLKFTFLHGLNFHVGRSLATGKQSAITWTKHFPHKTSLQGGGAFGYPDDTYIDKCNEALDKLGVPPAAQC